MSASKDFPQPRLRLAEARTLHGWSQQDVANRIGTTHVNISRWERGITKPGPYFRRKLSELYGKSEEELDLGPGLDGVAATSLLVSDEALYDPAIPPPPPTGLVGRDHELVQIKRRLREGNSVTLTALNGLPGVGKTTLAIALAHDPEIQAHFSDGILWAGLGPHPNLPGTLSHWGTLLGISLAEMATLNGNEAWARALHNAIGSRRMLLVLDDVWQVEDALACKVGGTNCAYLVTTRFPGIAAYIAVDGATAIQELDEEHSLQLLRLLAPEVVKREEKKIHDLIHAVGGLPLALTIMGNYLRKQAYSGQARRVHAALRRLSIAEERLQLSEPRSPVESHSSLPASVPLSLQSVIAISDQLLSKQEREALYALSVFPARSGSFSEEAALAVTNSSVEVLDVLMDRGLLESSGSGRYTLHQIIADYARAHLRENAAFERLMAYITHYVEKHKTDYELLELESGIILVALDKAYEMGWKAMLVSAVINFTPFLLLRGQYTLAEQYAGYAYEAASKLDDNYGITSALLYLGQIMMKRGSYPLATTYLRQGLTLARQIGDHERTSALLNDLGWVTWKQGDYAQAEAYLQEGLVLAREVGNSERISDLLEILGSVTASEGNYTQSEKYLQEALLLAKDIGDRERICSILINLGATAGEQGDHHREEICYQEGLSLAREIGHREWISLLLINLGDLAGEQQNYSQAEEYFREGLALAREIEHRERISALLSNLGSITWKQGNYVQAEAYLQESLELAHQIGNPLLIANALYESGMLYLHWQKREKAEARFHEMLTTIPEGDQELAAQAQYGLAIAAAASGNIFEARKRGEASLKVLEAMGHRTVKEVRSWLETLIP
ncbi:MAG TPA: tetratricopeptide repeat protein [Ktedonobacteraceae bacterium]|nr:tetratricopeptide repeat protein [Ktedonobacteraceae bacterium]